MSDKYLINSLTMTSIANAIRSKTGATSAFTPSQMIDAINNISGGSVIFFNQYASSLLTSYIGNELLILNSGFNDCTSLATVSFPNCSYIGYCAFNDCTSLATVSFPNCSYIGVNAFSCCTRLKTTSFPNCGYIGYCAFLKCSSLTTASFPNCSYIESFAFSQCRLLSSLYLNQVSSVPTLVNVNAFHTTKLSVGGTGIIYVPSSLYDSFKTATNWSTISARLSSM